MKLLLTIILLSAITLSAQAEVKTVVLEVPGMTCAACPVTVKKAISQVNGVSKVSVSYDKKEAIVTFDDQKTALEKVMSATENAGYPAKLKP